MGILSLGSKMLHGARHLGSKALKYAGGLGQKVTTDVGRVLDTLGTGLGPLATKNPMYQAARGAANVGNRVATFASDLGSALGASTLEEATEKLVPLFRDASAVYDRSRGKTRSDFLVGELERP